MDCKDCENYKPKEDKVVKKLCDDLIETINVYCNSRVCKTCNFGKDRNPCSASQIFAILYPLRSGKNG